MSPAWSPIWCALQLTHARQAAQARSIVSALRVSRPSYPGIPPFQGGNTGSNPVGGTKEPGTVRLAVATGAGRVSAGRAVDALFCSSPAQEGHRGDHDPDGDRGGDGIGGSVEAIRDRFPVRSDRVSGTGQGGGPREAPGNGVDAEP